MHHRIYAGAATACAVAIDVECEIADEVHVAGKDAECFRQPLADFRIAAGNAARGAIVDMRIRREDAIQTLERTLVDRIGVRDHQLFKLDAVGNLLVAEHGYLPVPRTSMSPGPQNERTDVNRSEEHTSELQSLMRISYA